MKKELLTKIKSFKKTYGYYGGRKELDGIAITLDNNKTIIVGYDEYNYYANLYLGEKDVEKYRYNKGLAMAEKLYIELTTKIPEKEIVDDKVSQYQIQGW